MPAFIDEVRFALRSQRKALGFTAVAVATLAVGIGANTAIFGVADAVLLRPLPFHDPDRLVVLLESNAGNLTSVAYPNYRDWRDQNEVFASIAAFQGTDMVFQGFGPAERVQARRVSAGYFRTLGVQPALGRDFRADDDRPGAAAVAVVSHSFWLSRLNGDAGAIGKTVRIDSSPVTLVGVLPPGDLTLAGRADLYVPVDPSQHAEERFNHNNMWVVARLKPRASLAQAKANMDAIARQLEREYPVANKNDRVYVAPLRDHFAAESRRTVLLFMGAVAFVLLIACVNVANLLLARAAGRAREFAVRAALGAGRSRLVRQLLTESVLLGVEAGLAGLLIAAVSLRALNAFVPLEFAAGVRLDWAMLAFAFGLSVVAGILFGCVPALAASKIDLGQVLKEGMRVSSSRGRRFRDFLIIGEVAMALVLLTGAGLMVRSIQRLLAVDPGFNPDRVLTFRLALNDQKILRESTTDGKLDMNKLLAYVAARQRDLIERLGRVPGVRTAATVYPLAMTGESCNMAFVPEGTPEDGRLPDAFYHVISPAYFSAIGTPLLSGRAFSYRDDGAAPRVAIVNETLAKRVWPNENPIGKRFRFKFVMEGVYTVVGVAKDTKQFGMDRESNPQMYLPFSQWPQNMIVLARTHGNAMAAAQALRRTVAEWDAETPVYDVKTMEERVSGWMAPRRRVMWLLGVFGSLALALTIAGIYSVMSYIVARQTREIGIRMALGATVPGVLRMILGKALALAGCGAALGLAGALSLTGLIEKLVFGVKATDPVAFGAGAAVMLLAAVAAALAPARRAATINPTAALRAE